MSRPGSVPRDWCEGVDLSRYQQKVDYKAVADSGKSFAFLRIADGTKHLDDSYPVHRAGLRKHGVLTGPYLFFRCADDVSKIDEQVNLLCSQLQEDDLLPVLDLEDGSEMAQPVERVREQVLLAIREVTLYAGGCIVYTAAGWWGRFMGNRITSPRPPLWAAHYGVERPLLPLPWLDEGYTFWQHTGTGSCPGIKGNADLNVFAGDQEKLRAFAARRC